MINLNEIKAEEIFKKTDNVVVIIMAVVALLVAFKINTKNRNTLQLLHEKISSQKSKDTLFSDIDTLVKDIQLYKKEIFFEKDSAGLLNLINEWAKSSGLDLISLRPLLTDTSGQFFNYTPITLMAKGDYLSLGQFLSLAEGYEGFIDITSLQISPQASQRENLAYLSISITLHAVVLKEPNLSEYISKK
ncbi:MAG: type 4a pilus biogenesis protein PilO [Candidatus Omnitrophota bacterium]